MTKHFAQLSEISNPVSEIIFFFEKIISDTEYELAWCHRTRKLSSRRGRMLTWRSRASLIQRASRLPQSLRSFAMTSFESQGALITQWVIHAINPVGARTAGELNLAIAGRARLLRERYANQMRSSFPRRRESILSQITATSAILCDLCVRCSRIMSA